MWEEFIMCRRVEVMELDEVNFKARNAYSMS